MIISMKNRVFLHGNAIVMQMIDVDHFDLTRMRNIKILMTNQNKQSEIVNEETEKGVENNLVVRLL